MNGSNVEIFTLELDLNPFLKTMKMIIGKLVKVENYALMRQILAAEQILAKLDERRGRFFCSSFISACATGGIGGVQREHRLGHRASLFFSSSHLGSSDRDQLPPGVDYP